MVLFTPEVGAVADTQRIILSIANSIGEILSVSNELLFIIADKRK